MLGMDADDDEGWMDGREKVCTDLDNGAKSQTLSPAINHRHDDAR